MGLTLSQDKLKMAYRAWLDGGMSIRNVVDVMGVSEETANRYVREAKRLFGVGAESSGPDEAEAANVNYHEDSSGASLSGVIKTDKEKREDVLDEFLKVSGIDLSVWEVESFTIGEHTVSSKFRDQNLSWDETGAMRGHAVRKNEWIKTKNKSIKVKLKRKKTRFDEAAIKSLIEKVPSISIPKLAHSSNAFDEVALEVAIYDAHIGKLAHGDEIGWRSWDTKKGIADMEENIEKHLNFGALHKPSKIFIIIGQDLFHTDNVKGQTSFGDHVLDVDTRSMMIYDLVYESYIKMVGMALQVAPVELVWVPGNHDYHTSYYLTHTLKQAYKDCKHVYVDIGKTSRKARLWGKTLVGWTHKIVGRHNTWANELAQVWPKEWAESEFREWHHGDQHKKGEIKTAPVFTSGGVTCRQVTALSEIDKWHYDNLFTDAVPGGESFLWSKYAGVFANYTAWVKNRRKKS